MRDFKHIAELLTSSFAETIWPTRCIGCDLPGTLLCPDCTAQLPRINLAAACPRCGAPCGWLTCTECTNTYGDEEAWEERGTAGEARGGPAAGAAAPDSGPAASGPVRGERFAFSAARAALVYEGLARKLVTSYKDAGERRLDKLLATLLLQALRATAPQVCPEGLQLPPVREDWLAWADALVAVPARPEALRQRGFDHLQRVAARVAEWGEVPLLEALQHTARTADQRALSAEQRIENLAGSFSLAPRAGVRGKRIVVLDDVLTTGATASAAAEALLAGGAAEVRVAVVARVLQS